MKNRYPGSSMTVHFLGQVFDKQTPLAMITKLGQLELMKILLQCKIICLKSASKVMTVLYLPS